MFCCKTNDAVDGGPAKISKKSASAPEAPVVESKDKIVVGESPAMPSKAKAAAVDEEVKQTEEAKNEGKINADESKPVSDLIDPSA